MPRQLDMVTFSPRAIQYSLTSTMSSISTTPVVLDLLTAITAGSTGYQRQTNRVIITRVIMSGTLVGGQSNLVTDDPYNTVRLSLITATTAAAFSGYSMSNPLSPYINPGLLRVHHDRLIPLRVPAADSTGYIRAMMPHRFTIVINSTINYSSTGSGGIPSPNMFLLALSDSSLSPSPGFVSGCVVVEFIQPR